MSDIRHDIRATISAELERNATNVLHRTVVPGQEGSDDKNLSVSDIHTLSITE